MNGTLIKKDGDWWVSFVFKLQEDFEYNELQIHNPDVLEDPIEGDDVTFSPMLFIGEEHEEAKHYALVRVLPTHLRDDYIMRQSSDPGFIEGAKWMRDMMWE